MSTDTAEETHRNWTPTRVSTMLALGGALVLIGLLIWQVEDVIVPIAAGTGGALCFAGSLWLIDSEGRESLTAVVVSLLTLPVGAGIVLAAVGTALLLGGALFPVSDAALLSVGTLVVIGHVGVVWGVVLAVLGVTLGVRNAGGPKTFARYSHVALRTGIVPAGVGLILMTGAIVLEDNGPVGLAGETAGTVLSGVLSPGPDRFGVAVLLALVAAVALTVEVAIRMLPFAELLGDSGAGETRERRVERFRGRLRALVAVAAVALVPAAIVEVSGSPADIEGVIGSDSYTLIQTVATSVTLRSFLLGVTMLSLAAVALSWGLRGIARSRPDGVTRRWGPVVIGGGVTVIALAIAEPVYTELVDQSAGRMPPPIEANIRQLASDLVEMFGMGSLVVGLFAILIATTVALVVLFRLWLLLGYLSTETAGYSLASGGLFVATVFAGTVGAPTWLVFGGVVISLFVWDTGRFGTTLGAEIGRRTDTRETELVHASGTLLVGVLGAAGAFGVVTTVENTTPPDAPPTVAPLLAVVAGIVLIVAALR
jgi:hypothetical protein